MGVIGKMIKVKEAKKKDWRSYKNGNCITMINLKNGTKIHQTINPKETEFRFDFAESQDLSITEKCDGGCSWCYQGCTPKGKHADLLNIPFLETLHPYTELAINGNDLTHPQLTPFLNKMQEKNIIVSMTVNQKHFIKNKEFIQDIYSKGKIKGIGVSFTDVGTFPLNEIKALPTVVIHVIAGLITEKELDFLSNHDFKILILGYKKTKNRGKVYYENEEHKVEIENNIKWLSENIMDYMEKFNLVSFDNLALSQLDMKNKVNKEVWEECYLGDDGTHTFYIDLVNKKFARTSMSEKQYDLLDNIDDMFKVIKKEVCCE